MNKNVLKIVLSQCLSRFGDNIEYIALCMLCYKITGNVISIGIVSVISAIPNIIFTLFGGAVSDRYDKKSLMSICEIVRAIVILTIPIMQKYNQIYIIYIVSFIVSTAESFFEPCCSGYMSCMLNEEEYSKVSGIANSAYQIVSIIGLTAGGFFISILGNYNAFYFDAFTFLVSAIVCLSIEKCEIEVKSDNPNLLGEIKDGIKEVFSQKKNIINLVLLIVISILISPLEPYITEYMNQAVGSLSKDFGIGVMFAILSIGVIIGNLLAVICNKDTKNKKKIITCAILTSIPGIMCISCKNIFLLGCGILIVGITSGCLRTVSVVNVILSVDKSYRSRTSSIILLITLCISPLATMIASTCISYNHLNIFWDFEIAFIIILAIVWWITYNDNEERCVETE